MELRKKIGLLLGPFVLISTYFSPILSQNPRAHKLLAIFLLIVIWWVTECIPIPITALLIPVLITAFGVASAKEAFAPFANPIIMLFLGSFILARAMCVHALDQKLAYSVLSLKTIGHKKTGILFALGLTSVFLSLWISNTATTAMMFPIALGVLSTFPLEKQKKPGSSFQVILLLTLAYAASIGGIGTPIGSPPNLIAIGMLEKLADYRITFFQWMVIGSLVLIPMFFVLFFLMKFHLRKEKSPVDAAHKISLPKKVIRRGLTRAQKNVLTAFSVTVLLWVFPKDVVARLYDKSGRAKRKKILIWIGSLLAFVYFALIIFTPLKIGSKVFTLGIFLYALGLAGFVIALINFKNTPLDQLATEGLYRISRHPQQLMFFISFLGICISIGSWLVLCIQIISSLFLHSRILAEEKVCLERYGDSYRDYMKRVPRYFLFF